MKCDKNCCHLSVLLGAFLLLSGFCMGQIPVLTMQPFTSNASCPVNKVDYIESEVTVDMTGVDGSLWLKSISIKDSNARDMIQANFGPTVCNPVPNNFFHCYKQVGDIYHFKYRLDSQDSYSGLDFSAVILDKAFKPVRSNWQTYPVTKDGQLQYLTINGETKSWRKGAQTYTVNSGEKLNITYNVTGISHTASHKISIQKSDKTELISSSSDFEISYNGYDPSGGKISVSYVADSCDQTTEVEVKVIKKDGGGVKNGGMIGGTSAAGFIAFIIGAVVAWKCMRRRLEFVTKKYKTLTQFLNDHVKMNPKINKTMEDNPSFRFEFYHKSGPNDGKVALDKNGTLADLVPKNERDKLTEDVKVKLRWSLDKNESIIKLNIINISSYDPGPTTTPPPGPGDVEMNDKTNRSIVDESSKRPLQQQEKMRMIGDLKALPGIPKDPNAVRPLKKKKKNGIKSAPTESEQYDSTDGKKTKLNGDTTNGRHSPGRPLNDTRIHPETDYGSSVGSHGAGGDPKVSTSQTDPFQISSNFAPRKLPPLKSSNTLPPSENPDRRPLPSPHNGNHY